RQLDVLVYGGQKVGTGGGGRGVVRQGKISGMREAHHLDLDGLDTLHSAASALVGRPKCRAMRPASRMATSPLARVGQSSTPEALIRCTVLRSPPNVPTLADTSLATIQAKPTTRAGRCAPGLDRVARMSGLAVSSRLGGAIPAFFLILEPAGRAAFQS